MDQPLAVPSTEPRPSRFDLHGRLFGASFRIHPFFWPATAAVGWHFYVYPDQGNLGLFFLWMLCVLVGLLIHDLGHVVMGRLLGVRLGIVWYGLGSAITNLETLHRRPARLAVYLAGPAAQLLVFVALWSFTSMPGGFAEFIPYKEVRVWTGNGLAMFMFLNFFWAVLNLVPIWPLDGGLFFREWCTGLFGRSGPTIALIVCIFVSAGLSLWFGHCTGLYAPFRFDPHGSVLLQQYTILLLFSVFLVIAGFRRLRIEYREWRGQTAKAPRRD